VLTVGRRQWCGQRSHPKDNLQIRRDVLAYSTRKGQLFEDGQTAKLLAKLAKKIVIIKDEDCRCDRSSEICNGGMLDGEIILSCA